MTDDTTTTARVRAAYVAWHGSDGAESLGGKFDRWLADHDQAVADKAWGQGYQAGALNMTDAINPYREAAA